MSDEGIKTPSGSGQKKASNIGVPAAIVLAGGLVALAIYFGGGRASVTQPANVPGGADDAAGAVPDAAVPTEPPVGDFRPVTADDHIRGSADAKITILEYSDTECPFCKDFQETMQQVMTDYPNDVRWVYRHAPLEQLHPKAPHEAVAVECAAEQGKFWEYLDKIYEVTPSNNGLDESKLPEIAQQVKVANLTQFNSCLSSDKYKQKVADDLVDAQAAGLRGTPYSILIASDGTKTPINGALPVVSVKAMIDGVLGK
ncbi:MAG: DsbA family protein [Candidatus Andersenbacteria bacterium]|nr:DsbA family protein [Candidatus Andersenbacteria bacterium]